MVFMREVNAIVVQKFPSFLHEFFRVVVDRQYGTLYLITTLTEIIGDDS